MIILTGDVHCKLGNWEEKKIGSEVLVAEKYLQILKKYKVACTLFVNGRCLEDEKQSVRKLLGYDVEFGGHTYDNFSGMNVFKSYIYRKLYGCIYGPAFYQKRDIKKTRKAFEKLGLKMLSWRTHAFGSNDETFKILAKEGVKYVSDLFGQKPFFKQLIHIPINIPVDQNTIAYGLLRPENRDPFASCVKARIKPEEWFDILKKRVKENERRGKVSIMLIHPATMACLDNFKLFEKIAKFLSKYKSIKVSEFRL